MSSRRSFGGGRNTLRETSSRHNVHRSMTPMRQSFGGMVDESYQSDGDSNKNEPISALERWRREKEKRAVAASTPSKMTVEVQKKPPAFATQEGSALERLRERKRKAAAQQSMRDENALPPTAPTSNRSTFICYDDDDAGQEKNQYHSTLSTPSSSRRRLSGLSSKARRRSFAVGSSGRGQFLSQGSEASSQPLSQLTTMSDPTPTNRDSPAEEIDTVEGAGLRSRVTEMQQRVEQLEKEKMALSMAMAPLQSRLKQKEAEWSKEETRLWQERDSHMKALQEKDEVCRDLTMKNEALIEENKQLLLAARKAAFSNTHQNDKSACSDDDVKELQDKLRHADEEIQSLRLEKVSVEKELNGTKIGHESLIRSYNELEAEYEELAASRSENQEAEIKLEVLSTEHIATSAQLNAVCSDLAETKARAEAALMEKDELHKKEIAELQFEISVLKTRAAKVKEVTSEALDPNAEDEAVLRARIEERDRRILELETELVKGEQIRRQMHNRIQELRGNIRVFVRTRPFLPGDGDSQVSSIDVCPDGERLSITDNRSGGLRDFKFDKVFPPSAGQDLVFEEVSDFVQSALDGYHVCLFSYGQTGSGKTHTMQGSGHAAMRGIIPRAVEKILSEADKLQNLKWDFSMTASFLEIYNEDLKDLLVSLSGNGKSGKAQKLTIKRNKEGQSYVEGLSQIKIDTDNAEKGMQQLEALMSSAMRARSVASTKMNAHSSRSHSVFMLNLIGYNEETGATVNGALNLCDLAGSERLDRSGAASDEKRLKETRSINKSLSSLGNVFNALATGASHIPFRDSKLTYLLQDCLSGDGKALMFVNLSPTCESSNESLCSLNFAQRVNQVELGKPTKHIQYSGTRAKK